MKLRARLQEIRLQSGMSPHNTALSLFQDFGVLDAEELYIALVDLEDRAREAEQARVILDDISAQVKKLETMIGARP